MYPKITIVTVTYNCKNMIESTIESVLCQSYDNTEYLIIDGGSTDGTVDIIRRYSSSLDYFISEKDNGIYDAMNKGLIAATGDWIIFMNAGDFFVDKNVLKTVIDLIDESAVVVYGDVIKQYDGYYYHATPSGIEHIEEVMPVFHQAAFVRLSYHKQHLFDCSYRSSGDYSFFYNCYFVNHACFQYVPVIIACFDSRGGMSKDNHGLSMRENLRIWGKEDDILFRTRLEFSLFKHGIKRWIKRYLINRDKCREIEISRRIREGKKVVKGDFKFVD